MAEILVAPTGSSGGRRGSGYLVAPHRVLTAAHVVEGAAGIRVRFEADRPGERVVPADVVWKHHGIDIAVLAVGDAGTDVTACAYGRLGEHDAVVLCTAVGFPRFKLRRHSDGSSFRDAEHIHARCAALSNRREGTLDLAVDSPPGKDPDAERDSWEGMSGAAVFSGGHLIGVVTRHHLSDGPGRIAAGRADRWAEALPPDELASLAEAVKGELRPHLLPDVLPAPPRGILHESYRAQLGDFAPEELRDRRCEIGSLVEFCGGREPYLWVQGAPWAGKTALAAWFALHPPRGVIPVWFFVTARYAGQADSAAYTEAVVDQLAAIAGREPVSRDSSPARNGELTLLLRLAAERVHEDGGTLVLIVDGLDEDRSLRPGGTGRSIASLLPERLPPGVRVLVTSRPGPGVPADVRGGHPLRGCPVLRLAANAAALHTEHEARFELRQALSGTSAQRDLVGLFTAARGPLKPEDLRELTHEPAFELRRLLDSGFGRILRPTGSGSPEPLGEGSLSPEREYGHVFSHETILAIAQQEFGPDLAPYVERLRAWAAGYARKGWPANTPAYLLRPYGRLAADLRGPRDTALAVSLVTDPRRHARLRTDTDNDAVCLAEIAAVHEAVRSLGTDDLVALTALAVAGDLVARRNEDLHLAVPAVYGRLGRVGLAVGLARSVFHPLNRGLALAKLAHVLGEAGDRRAVGLAEEAVRLAEGERTGRDADAAAGSWWHAKGVHAAALARTGRRAEAVSLLTELFRAEGEEAVGFVQAVSLAAVAVGDAGSMSGLLRAAEDAVDGTALAPHHRAQLLSMLAQVWADCGCPDERDRLHDTLLALVRQSPHDLRLPPIAAEAVRATRPGLADELAAAVLAAWADPGSPAGIGGGPGAVYALVAGHRMEEARRLASTMEPDVTARDWLERSYAWGAISRTLAEGWARDGRAAAAWAALAPSWSSTTVDLYRPGSAATVAELLAASGRSEEAEEGLATAAGVPRGVFAEAVTALAHHHAADDPDRALRLLHRAVRGPAGGGRTLSVYQQDQFADLAGGMAAAGRPDDAERLVAALADAGVRTRGWAAVSLAVPLSDHDLALRLAERAASMLPEVEDLGRTPGVVTSVVQALARIGATRRLSEVLDAHQETCSPFSDDFRQARIQAVALLWPHAPDMAGRLADMALRELAEATASNTRVAELLIAVGRHDQRRASAARDLLDSRNPGSYLFQLAQQKRRGWPGGPPNWVDPVLAGLLEATVDRDRALRGYIDPVVAQEGELPLPGSRAGAVALVYAALGDHDAALARARRARSEAERSEVLAHLAAHAACLSTDSVAVPLYEDRDDILPVVRRLAAQLLPSSSGPDLPRARALVAEALTPRGWHHAVPVLSSLAPAALLRAGASVFEDLEIVL
ncbi:trypsin-like peptidase domain-containing protein [Kitasatospora sp. MBT66]|uniref:trypsin-like peptidase domain-containing protein n=1 Tax=Kitasatospora sp. MBT66 TaxID=1444769 RepID=UPI0013147B9F|nr:trypsin-like peptidase domain-containing protein [Kitasatospora sp. MBT66]